MVHKVIYPTPGAFNQRLAIMTCREHLCGFHEVLVTCKDSETYEDPETGHVVCSGCERITVASGLRNCDICGTEYIDKTRVHSLDQDTNCPRCIIQFGIDE
jgi:hypothetical protein